MMLFSYNNLELWKKAWLHSMFMLIFVFSDRKGVRHDSWDAKRKDSSCYGSTGRIRLRGEVLPLMRNCWRQQELWNMRRFRSWTWITEADWTYTICGKRGSGMICLNGAAARCVSTGDKVIIMCYANYEAEEAKEHKPKSCFRGWWK